ncbi:MAG: response regulator transcription factor [Spirochaetia bacterium]|jgi:DNA-binding response OmpR family regulator|nr:response regulator transcription factor [Spirochaetia bacterium]
MNNVPVLTQILMIDDDEKLLDLMHEYFLMFQMDLMTAANSQDGLKLLAEKSPHLIVLDVMMPVMDGFETCREIRRKSDIPIIMLSARGDAMDKIVGLELGADDYMAKPFEPRELVTRIQTILKRSGTRTQSRSLFFDNIVIHTKEREAYILDKAMNLTSMEFELLLLLVQHPGRKFSRDEIMLNIQGFDSASYSRSIDILISRIRSKLGESAKTPKYIKSVHGFGYVFVGELS